MAKLSTEVADELEVLRSIYGDDFSPRPLIWNYPSFAVRLSHSSSVNAAIKVGATVRISLSAAYPKSAPKIEIEESTGLNADELKEIRRVADEAARAHLKEVMCYDILLAMQEYVEKRTVAPVTLYDSAINREQLKAARVETLRKDSRVAVAAEPIEQESSEGRTESFSTAIDFLKSQTAAPPTATLPNITEEAKVKTSKPWTKREISSSDESDESESYDNNNNTESVATEDITILSKEYDLSKSRYLQEFAEISRLGEGASGEVWRVRHKLDRRIYAVKKIDLLAKNNFGASSKIQREVTTVSRLIHKHVVRYYAAWIEEYEKLGTNNGSGGATREVSNSSTIASLSPKDGRSSGGAWARGNPFIRDNSNDAAILSARYDNRRSFVFEGDDNGNNGCSVGDVSSFGLNQNLHRIANNYRQYDDDSDSSSSDTSSSSDDDNDNSSDHQRKKLSPRNNKKKVTGSPNRQASNENSNSSNHHPREVKRWLFIQMEFCTMTLRQLIDTNTLYKDESEVLRLLRQMLSALAYIHERRVIHRDLKPANIFLDEEGNIKIGDFGLATKARFVFHEEDHNRNGGAVRKDDIEDGSSSLTIGVGTAMYRAPELEESQTPSPPRKTSTATGAVGVAYDEKADMYSLGIILYEMCCPIFTTGMERIITLRALRDKHTITVEGISENLKRIILWLTETDQAKRPSAIQLLQSSLIPSRSDVDEEYVKEVLAAVGKNHSIVADRVIYELFQRGRGSAGDGDEAGGSSNNNNKYRVLNFDIDSFRNILIKLNPRLIPRTNDNKHSNIIVSLKYENYIKQSWRRLCDARGAVELSLPAIHLSNQAFAAEFLDVSGTTVALNRNLVSPFARLAAFLNLSSSQRYTIDRVYLGPHHDSNLNSSLVNELPINQGAKQPLANEHAVFDIIAPIIRSRAHVIIAEVEVISLVDTFFLPLLPVLPSLRMRIGHVTLSSSIAKFCLSSVEASHEDYERYTDEVYRRLATTTSAAQSSQSSSALLLPKDVASKVNNFKQIINAQSSAMQALDLLEQEFYRLYGESDPLSTAASVAATTTNKSPPPAAAATATKKEATKPPTTAVAALDISSIGVKKVVIHHNASTTNKKKGTSSSSSSSSFTTPAGKGRSLRDAVAQSLQNKANATAADVIEQERLKKMHEVIRMFDDSLEGLRQLLQLVDQHRGSVQYYPILFDLSPSLLRNQQHNVYTSNGGMQFVVEVTPPSPTTASDATTTAATVASSSSNNKPRKRAMLCIGGHFEQEIEDHKAQCRAIGLAADSNSVTAIGCTLFVDHVTHFLTKIEGKLKKLDVKQLSPSLMSSLFGNKIQILVVSAPENTARNKAGNVSLAGIDLNNRYKPSATSIMTVVQQLRNAGIPATACLHQLQGFVPGEAVDICAKLGIPFLVLVERDSCDEVYIQMTQESVQVGKAIRVSLSSLVTWIRNNIYKLDAPLLQAFQESTCFGAPQSLTSSNAGTAGSGVKSTGGGKRDVNSSADSTALKGQEREVVLLSPPADPSGVEVTVTFITVPEVMEGKDVHYVKRKQRHHIETKQARLAENLSSIMHIAAPKIRMRIVGDSGYSATMSSLPPVIAIELTYFAVRTFTSFVMGKGQGQVATASVKAEWDMLVAQEATGNKRLLKNLLASLVAWAAAIMESSSNKSVGASKAAVSSLATPAGKGSSSAPPSNKQQQKHVVYVYSLVDEQVDLLYCYPHVISGWRALN